MSVAKSLLLASLLIGCVDPDQFETVDAAPDVAPDARVQPQPDRFVPPADMTAPDVPAVDMAESDAGDAGADAAGDGDADAAIDAAPDPDMALAPDVAPPPAACNVEFSVTVPADTPAGDLHLAGTFYANPDQNWTPDDVALRMTRDGEMATFATTLPNETRHEYKYTRGSWEAGEASADCSELPNRATQIECADDTPLRLVDVVIAWRDTCER